MNTLKKILTALIISTLGFVFTAGATPITKWNWEVNSAFTSFIPGGPDVDGSTPNLLWGDPTIISWGCQTSNCANEPVDPLISSLDVSSGSDGLVSGIGLDNGVAALTATLIHRNNPIYGATLTEATLSTKLFLTPHPTPAFDTGIPPLLFDIVFKETQNDGSGCGYSDGDLDDDLNPLPLCENDIFVVDSFGSDVDLDGVIDAIEYNAFNNTFNQQFGLGMYTYNIALMVDTLAPLADEVCARVGTGDPGCIGVTTFESEDNSFDVTMKVTQVPEPSTILLMSLALFGIVASMRTKQTY